MPEQNPILIHGSGSTARVTALALAAALGHTDVPLHCVTASANAYDKSNNKSNDKTGDKPGDNDWGSVLALSPAAKTMLDILGVWPRLDLPSAAVCDMAVYGNAAEMAHNIGLDFNPPENLPPNQAENPDAVTVLAHIVSRSALDRAIHAAFNATFNTLTTKLHRHDAALTDFDKSTGAARFSDGTDLTAALLVDCARATTDPRAAPLWRTKSAAQYLTHDYQAAALVCVLACDRPHGGQAVQIFLPDGPLALLPLPDPHQRALIWSLPHSRARALAEIEDGVFMHELARATQGHAGTLAPDGPRGLQKLVLALAENYVDERLCLLGDAAHIIHPLAGQGFNLALRDAAQLADTLFDAQALGLAFDGPHVLADYQALRRADGGAMAATTHILAEIFSGPQSRFTAPLARLGLALTGRMARANQGLAARFRAQANGGTAALPRLMRGHRF
jgi:2-octaprenyl-6-methoxyphenol hydroxylase